MEVYRLVFSDVQKIELGNDGKQTRVKNELSGPGSHSVSESSFTTGAFTAPPKHVQIEQGVIIVITAADGEFHIRIRGGEMSTGQFEFDRNDLEDFVQ